MTSLFKRPMTIAAIAAALLGSAGFSTLAYAEKGEKGEQEEMELSAAQIASTKLTLQDAISKAQVENKGQLVGAKLEDEDGKLVYAVEFQNGENEHEVLIDAQTGSIINGDDEE